MNPFAATFTALAPPLLADLSQLLSVLFIVFSIIVWVINQVAVKNQEAARKNQPRPRPIRPPQEQPEEQVEDFLRRAAQKRNEKESALPAAGRQGPASRTPAERQLSSDLPSQRRQAQRQGKSAPVQGRMAGAPAADLLSTTFPGNLVSSEFEQRSQSFSTFQSSLEQVDEATEARLHSTFDHQVGSLGETLLSSSDDDRAYGSTVTSGQPSSPDKIQLNIAALIASPHGLRDAIIMQEILKPRF